MRLKSRRCQSAYHSVGSRRDADSGRSAVSSLPTSGSRYCSHSICCDWMSFVRVGREQRGF